MTTIIPVYIKLERNSVVSSGCRYSQLQLLVYTFKWPGIYLIQTIP
jgi:hypothetical protein